MKMICLLISLLLTANLVAAEPPDNGYPPEFKVAPMYSYQKDGKVHLYPYDFEPFWFNGVRTEDSIQMKKGDHFSTIYGGYYHQTYFNGPAGSKLSFTLKTFKFQLGPDQKGKQELIIGTQVKSETILVGQENSANFHLDEYLATNSNRKLWRTRKQTSDTSGDPTKAFRPWQRPTSETK